MSEFTGELKLLAIDGDRVTFLRNPVDEMKLTIGARYGCAIVEIDEGENLVPSEPERTTVKRVKRNPSNVAAILSKDQRFQSHAASQIKLLGRGNLPPNEETANDFIRLRCGVTSRAELDTRPAALELFHELELEYYRLINAE